MDAHALLGWRNEKQSYIANSLEFLFRPICFNALQSVKESRPNGVDTLFLRPSKIRLLSRLVVYPAHVLTMGLSGSDLVQVEIDMSC